MRGPVLVILSALACASLAGKLSRRGNNNGPEFIVGGQDADKGEYPWQILLKYGGSFYCGGSILNSRTILTAAHCVEHDTEQEYADFSIIAGEHDVSVTEGDEQEINASKVIVHENYDGWELTNDIAILQLKSDLEFNNLVMPVPNLSTKQFDRDAKYKDMRDSCFTSGWGVFEEDSRTIPNVLQELPSTNVISNMKCNTKLRPWGFRVTRGMICTFDRQRGVCNGDSGGPMGCYNTDGEFTQIGIVSWGPSYYCSNGRQVFTRVSKYLDWIEENSL